ncbi:MAG: NUDIX hydrolase, partial [Myxococcales bacterium]|nr:NUDIX hydrolase [Myxococcales bacterium]
VQTCCFGAPERDPRGWVVSAAYLGLAPGETRAIAGDDARTVGWHRVDALPALAFDHADILAAARQRLRELTQTSTLPLQLLPTPLRTRQARFLYSQILGEAIKPTAFKAWLRRREAVERVGPAKFAPRPALHPDWLR